MKNIFALIGAFTLAITAYAQPVFFNDAQLFLKKYVNDKGMVAYEKIKQNPTELRSLTTQIAAYNPKTANDIERKAFYINAYNVLVINAIVQNNIPASPLDVAGFFDKKTHAIAGDKLTLNDIENTKLRTPYNDARVHFVLVCAAQSCPKLANYAYTPQNVETQLTTRTKLALNDPNFVRVKGDKIEISKLFEWYNKDFVQADKKTVVQYINQYRKTPLPAATPTYYEYSWKLNKQ
jgi:hypothetical protein